MTTTLPTGFKDTEYLLFTQPQNNINDELRGVTYTANIIKKYTGRFITHSVRFIGENYAGDDTVFSWIAIGF